MQIENHFSISWLSKLFSNVEARCVWNYSYWRQINHRFFSNIKNTVKKLYFKYSTLHFILLFLKDMLASDQFNLLKQYRTVFPICGTNQHNILYIANISYMHIHMSKLMKYIGSGHVFTVTILDYVTKNIII